MHKGRRTKIAILGGGPSGLAAAFELTSIPGWEERYEVTVYQQGFRLGGKAATGRGPHGRIEEHGIHVLMGWYENTFRMIRAAYRERRERGLAPRSPFQDWQHAFDRQHSMIMTSRSADDRGWESWLASFPPNDRLPGDGRATSLWDILENGAQGMLVTLINELASPRTYDLAERLATAALTPAGGSGETPRSIGVSVRIGRRVAERAHSLLSGDARRLERLLRRALRRASDISWALGQAIERIHCSDQANHRPLSDRELIARLVLVGVKGILEDVWDPVREAFDFDRIEAQDLRAFLRRHGADERMLGASIVRFMYTGTFADHIGQLAAGTALAAVIRFLGYKGSMVWLMKAGTADTVIAPIFQVLEARGVRFRFFHRVAEIHPSPRGDIERVTVHEQVKLAVDRYRPLVPLPVAGGVLDTWPERPRYEQLDPDQAKALEERGVDLESPWAAWEPYRTHELVRGADFDALILAIPIRALEALCPKIIAEQPAWSRMLGAIGTTGTMAMQLWLSRSLEELGLPRELMRGGPAPATVSYAPPLSAWSDASVVLDYERWPAENRPVTVAYFTGALPVPDDLRSVAPGEVQSGALEHVRDEARRWLDEHMAVFWPKGATASCPTGLDLGLLVHPEGGLRPADERLRAQYFRANIAPAELYTLSLPGSKFARLRADESCYENLFLAGDWTRNEGICAGFFEGAVTSGGEAARAALRYLRAAQGSG